MDFVVAVAWQHAATLPGLITCIVQTSRNALASQRLDSCHRICYEDWKSTYPHVTSCFFGTLIVRTLARTTFLTPRKNSRCGVELQIPKDPCGLVMLVLPRAPIVCVMHVPRSSAGRSATRWIAETETIGTGLSDDRAPST